MGKQGPREKALKKAQKKKQKKKGRGGEVTRRCL
jgi:hypothetical protein